MASFLDNTPVFKDYVSQAPLMEAMVSVGQTKQEQYNQGIQKIQAQIDQVAGMDVIRDVDKQYLQSKLNEIGSNVRKVAAGDFSNYQLVNSVGGMVTQIAKDKGIQTAVGNTAKYRKAITDMENAKKEGKSSPSNEYVFNKQVQEWFNNPDVKASFSGSYKPYTNWKKNGLEVIKALTKDETITEDAFTMDSRGNLVIADATVKKKLAGISPEKIQQALMVGLTPADFEQMEIDGVYSYANLDGPTFMKSINEGHTTTMKFFLNQKRTLENAKSSTTSVMEKEKLDAQIAELNRAIDKVTGDYQDIAGAAQEGNLDAAKARYFTRTALDGFSKAFSFTEVSQTYEDSPLAEAARWREEQNRDWKKFMLKYEQDERGLQLKAREVKAKEQEVEGYGGLPSSVPQEEVPIYTLDKVLGEITEKQKTVEALDNNFLRSQGKDQKWLDQQKASWEKSPSTVSPIIAEHFALTEGIRRSTLADQVMVNEVSKKYEQQYGSIDKYIPTDQPNLVYTKGSTKYVYTPKDFVDFNTERAKYIENIGGGVYVNTEKARQNMSDKMFNLFLAATKSDKNEAEAKLSKTIDHYVKTVNWPYQEVLTKINDEVAKEITNRISYDQARSYGIPTANAAQKTSIGTTLTQFADLAESTKGGLPNSPNFNVETARKLALDNDAKYSFKIVEGTERQPAMYEMSVTGKEGSVNFKVTPEQKASILGDRYESSPELQAAKPYLEQMRKMGGYSTSFVPGASNENTAYLSKIDFPNTRLYGVKGDIVTLSPNSGRYTVKLSIFDPVRGKWLNDIDYPKTGMINEEQIANALKMLTDEDIYKLINEKPATSRDLKQVEEYSKKPF